MQKHEDGVNVEVRFFKMGVKLSLLEVGDMRYREACLDLGRKKNKEKVALVEMF